MSSNLGIISVSLAPLPAFFLKEDNCLLHISIFGGKSGAPIVLTSPRASLSFELPHAGAAQVLEVFLRPADASIMMVELVNIELLMEVARCMMGTLSIGS